MHWGWARLPEVKSHVSHTAAVGSLGQLKLSRLQHLTGSPKAYVSGYTCLRILEQRPARSQPCRIHTITPRSSTLPGIPPPISRGPHLERQELSCPPALRFTNPPAPTPSFPFFLLPRRNRALLLKAEPSALPRDPVPISTGQELLDIPDSVGDTLPTAIPSFFDGKRNLNLELTACARRKRILGRYLKRTQ